MKTKTYYDDALLMELDANVIGVREDKNNYWIELDQTIFFPEGGGSPRDRGTIDGIEVLDLKDENGIILHLVNQKLQGKVHLVLDKKYRLQKIQCHTTEHLVSAIIRRAYGFDCPSAHYLSDGNCDIELDTDSFSDEQLQFVEKEANRYITMDLPVNIKYLTKDEAKKTTTDFSDYENLNEYRLVEIGEIDQNLCGCPHVPSLKIIKGINILGQHKVKNNAIITMMCGELLIENAHKYYDELNVISNELASKIDNAPEAVNNLLANFKKMNNRATNYKSKYLELYSNNKIQTLDKTKINIVLESHDDLELSDLQFLVSKFSQIKNVIIIGILKKEDGTSNLMIAKNKEVNGFMARDAFKEITVKYGYRGGGNEFIAQGGGKVFENMDEEILNIVKEKL